MWYRLTVVYNTYNAGLSIKGGTRYFSPPKMVFGTSWFWKCVVSDIHENCSNFNKKEVLNDLYSHLDNSAMSGDMVS
jgi:hypothetical protein